MMNKYRSDLIMKKPACLLALALALAPLGPVFGQAEQNVEPPHAPPSFQQKLQDAIQHAKTEPEHSPTRFSIDFPGGTPAQLVEAIQKAMGKPLNAIIPTEDADLILPPLKMMDVTASQLFSALEQASRKYVSVRDANGSYRNVSTAYGFRTTESPVTDRSIWFFYAEKPDLLQADSTFKTCRFYSLSPYLERGFTVDDITTAVETAWKMAEVAAPPELKYHKETKMLIAYGDPVNLKTISDVLNALPASTATHEVIDSMHNAIEKLQAAQRQEDKQLKEEDKQLQDIDSLRQTIEQLQSKLRTLQRRGVPAEPVGSEKSGK